MAFYQVSSRALRENAQELQELLVRFRSQKEELSAEEQVLMGMWEGDAHQTFHQAFIRDSGQIDAFAELVNNYIKVMETIAERYDLAESRNLNLATTRV